MCFVLLFFCLFFVCLFFVCLFVFCFLFFVFFVFFFFLGGGGGLCNWFLFYFNTRHNVQKLHTNANIGEKIHFSVRQK